MTKPKLFTPVELHIGEDYMALYGTDLNAAGDITEPVVLNFAGHCDTNEGDVEYAKAVEVALNSHQGLYDCLLWHHEQCMRNETDYLKTAVYRATKAALEEARGE